MCRKGPYGGSCLCCWFCCCYCCSTGFEWLFQVNRFVLPILTATNQKPNTFLIYTVFIWLWLSFIGSHYWWICVQDKFFWTQFLRKFTKIPKNFIEAEFFLTKKKLTFNWGGWRHRTVLWFVVIFVNCK